MRNFLLLLATLFLTLIIASCVKDSDELVFDNPLDESGTNWHDPVIDSVYFSDSSIPINDSILFTVKADPDKQHDPMDSAFVYDLETFDTVGRPFESGYAVIPLVKSDSGDFDVEYWISDKVGRRTERVETKFRVDLYPPEITPNNNWYVPSGQELPINMELFSSDENGSIVKYYFKSNKLQEYIEQDEPEIMPSWTIADQSQTEYTCTLYLKVMDDDSLFVEKETSVRVTRYKPIIRSFNIPEIATKGVELHVGVEADDDDNAITTYKWAIGKDPSNISFDKETTDPGFDTTFDEEGTYRLRVICVDAGGVESEMQEKTITINSDNTNVTISKIKDISSPVSAGTTLTFEISANPSNLVKSYNWVLIKNDKEEKNINSGEASFTYTFDQPGDYRVEVRANGILSNTETFSFSVVGNEVKPTVDITSPSGESIELFRDKEFTFTASSSLSTDEIDRFEWYINNTKMSEGPNFTYTFDQVSMEIRDLLILVKVFDTNENSSDFDTLKVVLNDGKPEITEIIHNLKKVENGSVITTSLNQEMLLNCRARDSNIITGRVKKLVWTIKKEGSTVNPNPQIQNVDGITIFEEYRHTFLNSGRFTITVIAIDNQGISSEEFSFMIEVSN